jgi:hypothetical protein
MRWGALRHNKPAQTARDTETGPDGDLNGEEWSRDATSPFLRWLGSARLALCGERSSCSCTTFTMGLAIAQIGGFCVALLVISAPAGRGVGHASAFLGPSGCAMLEGGALWPSGLRHGQFHMLLSAGFVFASLFHMLVAVISFVRYGLTFEAKRGWGTFLGVFFATGAIGALSAGATLPTSILAAGSSAPLAFMGDELVTVIWSGGFALFDGGSRRKRALPLRLLVLAGFTGAHLAVLVFFSGGAISFWACLASFCFGMLVSMTASPSSHSRSAKLDDGQGTGDAWASWKKYGHLVATFGSVLFGVAAVVGFEQVAIPDRPAPC